ncbi:hypothetical protein [Actinomyces culturomici]|uniref:hypothetical protein n=1 Tax=Actinomyces culturomici TaxID=1926276 RepID=UPI000E1FF545|nr:hypothetical protein [Actinomyces culturomici]
MTTKNDARTQLATAAEHLGIGRLGLLIDDLTPTGAEIVLNQVAADLSRLVREELTRYEILTLHVPELAELTHEKRAAVTVAAENAARAVAQAATLDALEETHR